MWPNCVKPILTRPRARSPPLSLYNGSTGSRNHGHCTHPSPPLMGVGAALQILQPAHITDLNGSPSCSFLSAPHPPHPAVLHVCISKSRANALRQQSDGMIWNMSKWRGHAGDRYSWKIQTEADKEDVLLQPKMPSKCQSVVSNHPRTVCLTARFPSSVVKKIKKKTTKKSPVTY